MQPHDEKALENVRDLFRTTIGTSGIMLALIWGLSKAAEADILTLIRIASIVLVISIFFSLLGFQFIVSRLEQNTLKVTKSASVVFSFIVAWISFLGGCVFVIIAIFTFKPSP